ncbi:MAG TPA: NAD-glutamate dehydrogenase domain-containing protein [Candidatus Sulfotelmatobacter sp.]|jgi:glutamate dehydrogenase|nr:NAD-glutamate dehydrogenase domain-containing protein [Candidatus Sulfotelmatobacter sp.]
MAQRIDHLKDRLIDRVTKLAEERVPAEALGPVRRLLAAFYANVVPEDILHREPESLYAAVMALHGFARQRKPGQPKLRLIQPRPDEGGWESEHAVLQIVNDDMPFLVDSITGALQRLDIAVHLVVHPILPVSRDGDGKLTDFPEEVPTGSPLESLMHIEIDRQPADRHAAIEGTLTAVLADVRAAVEDWRPMRARTDAILADLSADLPNIPVQELTEARDFIDWLLDDHFTFLGCRSFRFEGETIVVDDGSGLGLLRDASVRVFDEERDLASMPPEVVAFLRRPSLLLMAKADRASSVHRPVLMDIVGIKRFDDKGNVVGMHVLAGLYAAAAYTRPPALIPLLRRKVQGVIERAGFRADSHDGRALQVILENYPRDELMQAGEEVLFDTALAILRLQERQKVALFLRRDEFGRFVSALVFIPRDRYDTALRLQVVELLENAIGGKVVAWYTQVADNPLARLHFIIRTGGANLARDVDPLALEARLAEAARSWSDRLQEVLVDEHGEDRGLALYRRWGRSFSPAYRDTYGPRTALVDLDRIEAAGDGVGLHVYRPLESAEAEIRFKIYRKGDPVHLSDVLPVFEHLGFKVISEVPHALNQGGDAQPVWIHDFTMVTVDGASVDIESLRVRFEEAFRAIWQNAAEDDGFNRLIINGGLSWRQVMVLRAYAKYLRQAGSTFSQAYVEKSVTGNPLTAALLVQLFERRFDPAVADEAADIHAAIEAELEKIVSADEDRILRWFLNLIDSTLRTNFFQGKDYLSIKLDSKKVTGLPLPRPNVEVFVYSPRVEGIHLRGGKVARGGIRWSDRPEDFRTEILGLIKAQMVKNAVIVPVGSKGGFVVKQPPKTGGREAFMAEGVECYKTLMRGLLDITDNLADGAVVPPANVVRRDADDPYLVVAADKGTATFSDIANGISAEYGFWLGDAFASGGSQGYDHKVMGITARGAWESVKRHFREMGIDCQEQDFTAIGVGDMSGDVFGNGMLNSRHTQLLAAFDHRHIFVDPNPDASSSYAERQRMFALPRSSWADYDVAKLSAGGAIFPRDAKSVSLTPQIKERFAIEADHLTPTELIRILLTAPVDLLWFGGIGTYVKSEDETNAEVGDRANEALRINGKDLRCKVIGEGANLAMTQLGRVEYALAAGRGNTDAIDNSAGVDCSDHEVNIKILVDSALASGDLTQKQRNELLAAMTDEVGHLVLRDNYLQSQAITLFEAQAPAMLDQQERFMRLLERAGRLDRAVEFLPDDAELSRRSHSGRGLTRPEIAVLLAYSKMWLYDAILESDLPDDPMLAEDLIRYFPKRLDTPEWRERMANHRLRREIIATVATNSMVNRIGGSIVARLVERTGTPPAEVARAYLIARDAFGLREVWKDIEALDNKVPATVQTAMLIEANRLLERAVSWVLAHAPRPIDMARLRVDLAPGIQAVRGQFQQVLPPETAAMLAARAESFREQGVPEDLAQRVAALIVLASANDIARIAMRIAQPVEAVGQLYFLVGGRFGLGWLRASAEKMPAGSHWQKMASDAVIDDLYVRQAALCESVAQEAPGVAAEEALAAWIENRKAAVARTDQLLAELRAVGKLELASLTVASHQFRGLTER